jgi:UPF0755 protein
MAGKKKIGWIVVLIITTALAGAGYWAFQNFYKSKVKLSKDYEFIYIQTAYDLNDILFELKDKNILNDTEKFEWLAKQMDLEANIHPGKYRITNGMSTRQIINLIKYNKQEKIRLSINSQIRDLNEFIKYIDEKLEIERDAIMNYFSNNDLLKRDFKLNTENAFAAIIPGTYDVSWAISLPDLIELLKNKYNNFWTPQRMDAALKNTGLNVPELITLASIVQNESHIPEEQEKIAGVYLNRLNKGMMLQADPTLVFANKKWGAQRVYDKDKEIDSPYNTYRYKGLPPGPISLVNPQTITSVINYRKHRYLFFCAKPDLTGYSNFSETYDQHQKFAREYQNSITKKGVK